MPRPPSKPRTLLVLGAGASIGAKRYPIHNSSAEAFPRMPSSRNFFYDLFHGATRSGRATRSLNMLGLMYEGVEKLIRRAWGLSMEAGYRPEEWKGINIEDVLSFVDVGSRMYSRGSSYHRAFRGSREALVEFIVVMLLTRSHGQHCESLAHLVWGLRPSDSIISFNYDTIADFTLQHTGSRQYRNYARLMSGTLPHVREYERVGVLLKLHGSVNWHTCGNRRCRMYRIPHIAFASKRRRLPLAYLGALGKCSVCGNAKPLPSIIPPLSEKNLAKHDFFHRLWLIARAQLPLFERIVFVGYSFPPNDSYSEWLFRQLRFVDQRQPPKIVVANPEAMMVRGPVRQRYNALFRGLEIEYLKDLDSLVKSWH